MISKKFFVPIEFSSGSAIISGNLSIIEGQVSAPIGSLYISNTSGVFIKTSGSGNTGWDAVATIEDINDSFLESVILKPSSISRNIIQSLDVDYCPLTIKQKTSQTASLIEFRNASNDIIGGITSKGMIFINSPSLLASDCGLSIAVSGIINSHIYLDPIGNPSGNNSIANTGSQMVYFNYNGDKNWLSDSWQNSLYAIHQPLIYPFASIVNVASMGVSSEVFGISDGNSGKTLYIRNDFSSDKNLIIYHEDNSVNAKDRIVNVSGEDVELQPGFASFYIYDPNDQRWYETIIYHTHNVSDIVNFSESVDDRVAQLLVAGSDIALSYNDTSNTITISSTGSSYTNEQAQDTVANMIQSGTGISWTYNDTSNTLTGNVTLSSFSTSNLPEGSNLYYTDERVDDRVFSLLSAGSGISLSYNDTSNILTISASVTSYTDEQAQDAINNMLVAGSGIDAVYNDTSNTLTLYSSVKVTTGITIGGGGVITTGSKGYIRVANGGTISKVSLLADQSGTIAIDIKKTSYSSFPASLTSLVGAGTKPNLSSSQKYEDSTLTSWTTSISSGDILEFVVDSGTTPASVTQVTVIVEITPL